MTFHAVVDHHEALLAALRHRVEELGLTLEAVENIAGLQAGYGSKILSTPPRKRMNAFTWFLLIQALGLRMVLEEDPELVERMRGRWTKRHNRKPVLAAARIIQLTPDYRRRVARLGGFARRIGFLPIAAVRLRSTPIDAGGQIRPPPFAESGRCDAPRLVALKAAPIAGCTQGAAANRPAVRTFETLVADIPAEPAPRLTQGRHTQRERALAH